MNLTFLMPPTRAADQPLDRLAQNPNLAEGEKIAEVARQFEAILLRQILQQARKTVIDSDLNSESATSSIYQDMVTDQLADAISRSGTFGLAKALEGQLGRQAQPTESSAPSTLSPQSDLPVPFASSRIGTLEVSAPASSSPDPHD